MSKIVHNIIWRRIWIFLFKYLGKLVLKFEFLHTKINAAESNYRKRSYKKVRRVKLNTEEGRDRFLVQLKQIVVPSYFDRALVLISSSTFKNKYIWVKKNSRDWFYNQCFRIYTFFYFLIFFLLKDSCFWAVCKCLNVLKNI